jgi:MoaA/NifB/PqqE/SkfB family radical SAM enzyme
MLRLALWGLFHLNVHALRANLLIQATRLLRWLPERLRALRTGIPAPQVLQVVDDILCRARCTHCVFNAFDERSEGLSLDELASLFDQAADMGVSYVYLIGADPFHREPAKVEAWLDLLASRRWLLFYLFTEGTRVSPEHVERLRRAGNIVPVVNIDGLQESTEARKGEGSFERLRALLLGLRARRVPWFASTMVSTANHEEVTGAPFVDWLGRHGAWLVAYVPYTPADRRAEASLTLSREQRRDLYERALRLNRGRSNPVVLDLIGIEERLTSCPSAHFAMTVFHEGTLTPCVGLPLGHRGSNIREQPLARLFAEDPLYVALRARRRRERRPHCMVFTDPAFIRQHLAVHRADIKVLAPSLVEIAEQGRIAEGRS